MGDQPAPGVAMTSPPDTPCTFSHPSDCTRQQGRTCNACTEAASATMRLSASAAGPSPAASLAAVSCFSCSCSDSSWTDARASSLSWSVATHSGMRACQSGRKTRLAPALTTNCQQQDGSTAKKREVLARGADQRETIRSTCRMSMFDAEQQDMLSMSGRSSDVLTSLESISHNMQSV